MQGPDASKGMPRLYEGLAFRLKVKFPPRYPLESPEARAHAVTLTRQHWRALSSTLQCTVRRACAHRLPRGAPLQVTFMDPTPIHPHICARFSIGAWGPSRKVAEPERRARLPAGRWSTGWHNASPPRTLTGHQGTAAAPALHALPADSNGHICLDILYDSRNGAWSPALTINRVRRPLWRPVACLAEAEPKHG